MGFWFLVLWCFCGGVLYDRMSYIGGLFCCLLGFYLLFKVWCVFVSGLRCFLCMNMVKIVVL